MRRLEGKVIVLAGAGGIGDEVARRFAAEGAQVVVGDRHAPTAQACVESIEARGGTATAFAFDGADETSVGALVRMAVETYGGLDGFHCNFANFADGRLNAGALEIPLEVYDEVMRVNARGYLLCTRAALPAMFERGGGVMLYTSSGAALGGDPTRVGYTMSKSAVHALMRNVASRYGERGVRANVIAPGLILHNKLAANITPGLKEKVLERTPIKSRLGRSEDIAAIAAMLMSDDGGYITGQTLSVDGGATMRL